VETDDAVDRGVVRDSIDGLATDSNGLRRRLLEELGDVAMVFEFGDVLASVLAVLIELLRTSWLAVEGRFAVVMLLLGISGGRGVVANDGGLTPRKATRIRALGPWIMTVL
jgi:hypothetical protein